MAENWINVDAEGHLQEETYCIKCDNDITGEKASGLCPHCGSAVAPALAGEPVCHSDDEGKIAEHVACTECGNDLHGIPVDGNCEVCETPCTHSLGSHLLRYADVSWLRNVKNGVLWYVIFTILAWVLGMGSGAVFLIIKDRAVVLGTTAAIGLFSAVLIFLATWFVTTPAPTDVYRKTSTIARFMAGLLIFGVFLNLISIFRPDLGMWPALPGILINIGFAWAFYSYIDQLTWRLPDEKLHHHVRIVLIGSVIAFSIMFIGSLLAALSGVDPFTIQQAQQQATQSGQSLSIQGSYPMFLTGSLISGCLGGMPLFIFGVWGIIVLFMLRNRLSACIRPETDGE